MTIYTKDQIENGTLSAQDLLLSFNTGNNAATKTPSLLKGIHNGAVQGKPVSIAVLTAYAEFMAAKSKELAEALQSGYIAPRHKMQYAIAQDSKPLEGHFMTSAQWLQSCIDMLPSLPSPDYEGHAALIETISDSMTKTQILDTIDKAKALVNVKYYTIADCTFAQSEKYYDLLEKETIIDTAKHALSTYLDDVKPVKGSDSMVQGKYYMSRGTMPLLRLMMEQEGWTVVVDTPVPTKIDVDYNVIEEEHRLFSIKVIKA